MLAGSDAPANVSDAHGDTKIETETETETERDLIETEITSVQ